jgi:hypothetical protein
MNLTLNAEPLYLPELQNGPALTVPATVSWAGPTAATIATANLVQQLAAARSGRRGWFIQNFSTVDMWIDDTADPVENACICVGPGQEYCCAPNMVTGGVLKIKCSQAGAKFAFREAY